MATSASPAIWSGAQRQHGRAQRGAHRRLRPRGPAASTRARRSASSTTPRPSAVATSAAARAGLGHPPRGLADRRARRPRTAAAAVDERAQLRRAQLGQAVRQVARCAPSARAGSPPRSACPPDGRAPAAPASRGRTRHDARLARADGERGREPGQQRRMAEGLARLEHVDHLVAVVELHRARAHDVERVGRRPVLDQRRLAGGVGALRRRRGQRGQLVRRQPVEGRMAAEELRDVGAAQPAAVTR